MTRDGVIAWADDAYAIGSQLASVTGLYGPQLEENLALGSFAQDHLGHARALYLRLEGNDDAVDRLIFTRDPGAYRTSLLAGEWRPFDWAFVCTRGLCYALADSIRCRQVERDGGEYADVARIIARDTAVHVQHWQEWLETIAAAGEAQRVNPLVVQLMELTGEFYSDAATPGKPDELLAEWVHDLREALAHARLPVPELGAAELRAAASRLAAAGLSGRGGRHGDAFRALVVEAGSVYRAHPGASLA